MNPSDRIDDYPEWCYNISGNTSQFSPNVFGEWGDEINNSWFQEHESLDIMLESEDIFQDLAEIEPCIDESLKQRGDDDRIVQTCIGESSKNKRKVGDIDGTCKSQRGVEKEVSRKLTEDKKYTEKPKRTRYEVHNAYERRRRGRFNEKLKTLQQLVPHSCKQGKASILDEIIQYIKALQQQVEMMSNLSRTISMSRSASTLSSVVDINTQISHFPTLFLPLLPRQIYMEMYASYLYHSLMHGMQPRENMAEVLQLQVPQPFIYGHVCAAPPYNNDVMLPMFNSIGMSATTNNSPNQVASHTEPNSYAVHQLEQ